MPSRRSHEQGSLIVEAAIGVALLGVAVGGLASIVVAAIDAHDRAARHHAALQLADAHLELASLGFAPTIGPPGAGSVHAVAVEVTHTSGVLPDPSACPTPDAGHPGAVEVHIHPVAPGLERSIVLGSLERPGQHPDALGLRIHMAPAADADAFPAGALVLIGPDGAQPEAVTQGPGCSTFAGMAPGRWWITEAVSDTPLVDRSHVAIATRPIPVTIATRAEDRPLDIARAGLLGVVVEHGDARPPDHLSNGALRWFVRGDDARTGTDIGASRPVHPGPVSVVVSACDDAETTGSSATVTVPSGGAVTLGVPLAVVTVENVGERTDAWLRIQRTTRCADGTGRFPWFRYEGGLQDGMRVALPRGEWEARLTTSGSAVLTGSVRFVAAGDSTVVRIP